MPGLSVVGSLMGRGKRGRRPCCDKLLLTLSRIGVMLVFLVSSLTFPMTHCFPKALTYLPLLFLLASCGGGGGGGGESNSPISGNPGPRETLENLKSGPYRILTPLSQQGFSRGWDWGIRGFSSGSLVVLLILLLTHHYPPLPGFHNHVQFLVVLPNHLIPMVY